MPGKLSTLNAVLVVLVICGWLVIPGQNETSREEHREHRWKPSTTGQATEPEPFQITPVATDDFDPAQAPSRTTPNREDIANAEREEIAADVPVPMSPLEPSLTEPVSDYPFGDSFSATTENGDRNRFAAFLQDRLDEQPYDGAWAGATESRLTDLFYTSGLAGSHLTETTCRTTLCRIEVAHDDTEAEQSFLAHYASSGDFAVDDRTGFYRRLADANGSIRTEFFLARDGHEFPGDSH